MKGAKKAYLQRLASYLRKSKPVWDLINGKPKCPIATDPQAMRKLKSVFGGRWNFKPSDIERSLALLQRTVPDAHDRVLKLMDDDSDPTVGSWLQRNTALYATICDTMDLSKNGADLDLLEIVAENNGLAMYSLVKFRLAEIKSSDPLARAIQLKMGITHIRYEPKPHGVAKYFAEIEAHRVKLATLSRPKIIGDWEVTAKALRELPQLHEEFKSVALVLKLQRNTQHTETTLEECRNAFISADNDHGVSKQLSVKKPNSPSKKKRSLRANLARQRKRTRNDKDRDHNSSKYNYGDCAHHPNSNSHATAQCTNPFGYRSAFGRATSYADKCTAVKESVAAGWSPKATNVRIPQGYGCDRQRVPKTTGEYGNATPNTPKTTSQAPMLKANNSTLQQSQTTINADDLRAYNKVRLIMGTNRQHHPHNGIYPPHMLAQPLRAYHAAPAYGHQIPPLSDYTKPNPLVQSAFAPPRGSYPNNHTATPPLQSPQPHMPAPIHANVSRFPSEYMPSPTNDDLIAAGMRYFATQAGRQDFH